MTRQQPRSGTRRGTGPLRPARGDHSEMSSTDGAPEQTEVAVSAVAEVAPVAPIAVVGIGASAGGLDAFLRLMHHLPPTTGLAYVLVQHLDPAHESLLPELLGRASTIPVVQAADGMRVDADRAYVIPPNTTMTVTDGHLRLVARKKGRGPHLPIDAFFCSLAGVYGSNSVGAILSGAGSDGALGIQAIKEAGGITIAQDASAHFPDMPRSAVATGAVDFILPPEEIAEQIARLGAHLARHREGAQPTDDPEDEDLRKILVLLRKRSGVDFQHYRRGTLHRRILRRMLAHRHDTRGDYLAHIRLDPGELDVLYEDVLIGVTRFFRDPEVFEKLQTTAFPEMMAGRAAGTPLRMWIAGCAGGEEAYSLAIALLEFLGDAAGDIPIQIFGTDLSEISIAKARTGLYPATIAADVSPERLRRFFVTDAAGYRIAKSVRDLCIFSRQNVLRDPPFSHLDLISCRNVLIYLQPALQRRVFPTFHYALEPHGMLVLGSAESVGSTSEHFEALAKRYGIYRRRPAIARPLGVDIATPPMAHIPDPARRDSGRRQVIAPSTDEIEAEADRQALARFTPPGVVINDYMDVVQFRGDTSAFLAHAPGMASLVLLKLARPELVMPLNTVIRQASRTGEPVRQDGIVLADSDAGSVTIDVLPFRPPSTSARFFVVSFTLARTAAGAPARPADAAVEHTSGTGRRRGRDEIQAFNTLRDELDATKRYLQDIVQQHEVTTEELRAANEEIQSSNEELQSANEELETTKEEIQSTNEELTTLNDELRYRNHELAALSDDLSNVLSSTTIPIVIVGADLRLRRFTPATERVMRVIASDLGRPLGDIKLRVALPDLEHQITGVVQTLTLVEQEVRDDEGRWWALTIRPYQTIDHLVDGVVLVFADIDASKRFGERAHEVAETRRQLLDVAEAGRATADDARHTAEIANKAKTHFLASISHDLRTPLNAIIGYTELLTLGLRGPVTEEQLLDLGRIARGARYLLALINDILTFAKVEAGSLDIRMAEVPMAAMAAELRELITPQLDSRSLLLERPDPDVIVRGDPEKVRQVLLNLLTNALQFTPHDGRIGIDYVTTDAVVRIEVWDTGRGIAHENIERIFDPFVQIDRRQATAMSGGVGLGLAISRALARAMNGELTVESTLGAGSRFTLTLQRV